ncbi:MAG: hypothetical protein PHU69_12565 [Fermentimonas sp.]|nr:hypothetical protein [Fermentimonas sp.]
MSTQLSFLEPIAVRRKYLRDRRGRFANKKRLEVEEAKQSAEHYRKLYESEKRKLMPVLRRMIRAERELYNLKNNYT